MNLLKDLQVLIHEDMTKSFDGYPKKWGLNCPDPNIDHRRVLDLITFFERKGKALPIAGEAKKSLPGDIVAWRLLNRSLHIGVISNVRTSGKDRYLVVHHIGLGKKLEEILLNIRCSAITGILERVKMRLMILWVFAIQILLISLFIPAIADAEERLAKMENRFELFILKESWIEFGSTYDPQVMQERLKQIDYRKSSILVITEEEIETYDWGEQSIILTPRASHQLKDDLKKKLGKRGFLNQLAFTLSFDNEPYLRGLFLDFRSAVFIRIPIIYFDDRSKERFTLYIRPFTTGVSNDEEIPPEGKGVIEIEAIKKHFNELGKLR